MRKSQTINSTSVGQSRKDDKEDMNEMDGIRKDRFMTVVAKEGSAKVGLALSWGFEISKVQNGHVFLDKPIYKKMRGKYSGD